MPCHPLMCHRAADCRDTSGPGHPHGAAAYLDEHDRRALAHYAAMNAPVHQKDEITFAGAEPLELAAQVERIALCVLPVLALLGALWLWLSFR